jgi:hypothetical protein
MPEIARTVGSALERVIIIIIIIIIIIRYVIKVK